MTSGNICSSCGKNTTNDNGAVRFKCPRCGEYEIVRCSHCREIVAKYTCPGCGFEGPN